MSTTRTPWVDGNFHRTRFYEEQGHLVKETDQPDRGLILSTNVDKAKQEQKRFMGGWQVGSIPEMDFYRIVLPKYPHILSTDKELRDKELIKFSNDPDMAIYRVKKA
jgi:hypothetical protein